MTQTNVAEIVTFRAAAGISADDMRARAGQLTSWLTRQHGFIARTLSVDEGGTWTDHVLWASHEAAIAADQAFMREPTTQGFMAAIDPASISMAHGNVSLRQTA